MRNSLLYGLATVCVCQLFALGGPAAQRPVDQAGGRSATLILPAVASQDDPRSAPSRVPHARAGSTPVITLPEAHRPSDGAAVAHDLTFEDRVRAQEAIERVYYSHQIGATKPFEEAVPREVIEAKVRRYLKLSVALEQLWNAPVTAAMLDTSWALSTPRTVTLES